MGLRLSGQLNVPESIDGTVTGSLGVLHWQAAQAPSVKVSGSVQSAMVDVDPASIPSLAFEVEDAKFGQVKFGRMELRTRHMSDGMQVDQLQTNSPSQRLSMFATWRVKGKPPAFDCRRGSIARSWGVGTSDRLWGAIAWR